MRNPFKSAPAPAPELLSFCNEDGEVVATIPRRVADDFVSCLMPMLLGSGELTIRLAVPQIRTNGSVLTTSVELTVDAG